MYSRQLSTTDFGKQSFALFSPNHPIDRVYRVIQSDSLVQFYNSNKQQQIMIYLFIFIYLFGSGNTNMFVAINATLSALY